MAEISEQERQRRRDLAIELHKQGRFGGKQPGSGRPRKKRASEVVAEEVSKQATKISKELFRLLHDDSSTVRLKAASKLLEIEAVEVDRQMEEERHLERLRHDELVAEVVYRLERLNGAGVIDVPGFEVEAPGTREVRALEAGEAPDSSRETEPAGRASG